MAAKAKKKTESSDRPPTPRELKHQLEMEKVGSAERIAIKRWETLQKAIPTVGFILVAWILYQCLLVVAKVVDSDVLKVLLHERTVSTVLGVALTFALAGLRTYRKTERGRQSAEHQHTKALEQQVDPGRSSSDMPYTGDTRKGD